MKILFLWLAIVASLGNASALTPGAMENRVWEKSFTAIETRQAEPTQTLGRHQENEGAGYDNAPDSLLAAEEAGAFSRLAQPGGLTVSENAGGHLLGKHVGLSDADLAARLSSQPGITAASTFATRAEAEAAVAGAFDANAANVSAWTASGANGRLVLNAPFSGGSVLQRGADAAAPGNGVRVVLQGNGSGEYHILTGFPTP